MTDYRGGLVRKNNGYLQTAQLLERCGRRRIAHNDTVQEVTLDDVPPEAKKLANEAWHHLMHYATDEDIRSRDADYAKDQMELARWYEEKLRALFG